MKLVTDLIHGWDGSQQLYDSFVCLCECWWSYMRNSSRFCKNVLVGYYIYFTLSMFGRKRLEVSTFDTFWTLAKTRKVHLLNAWGLEVSKWKWSIASWIIMLACVAGFKETLLKSSCWSWRAIRRRTKLGKRYRDRHGCR